MRTYEGCQLPNTLISTGSKKKKKSGRHEKQRWFIVFALVYLFCVILFVFCHLPLAPFNHVFPLSNNNILPGWAKGRTQCQKKKTKQKPQWCQTARLCEPLQETKRPSKEMQVTIARQLGLEPTTVGNFFMNARRRSMDKWKDESMKGRSSSSDNVILEHLKDDSSDENLGYDSAFVSGDGPLEHNYQQHVLN